MGFAPGKQRTGTQQALLTCWCILGQSEIWCWCWFMWFIMRTVTCTCCLLHSICYMPITSDQLALLLAQELLQEQRLSAIHTYTAGCSWCHCLG